MASEERVSKVKEISIVLTTRFASDEEKRVSKRTHKHTHKHTQNKYKLLSLSRSLSLSPTLSLSLSSVAHAQGCLDDVDVPLDIVRMEERVVVRTPRQRHDRDIRARARPAEREGCLEEI